MELATSRGKGDGSSGSAAAMSALKLDPVGSAVISRLDEYQDALNATPDPAFIASAIQSLGKREEAVTEPVVLHHALKYGMPSSSQDLRFLRNFVLDFDTRTRNPRWVLEHITRDQTQGTANRKNLKCYEDEELHPRFRSLLSAFKDSGFDKGHMAPAANHKETRDAMRDTFVLSNICPQVGDGFNRDYWARFEQFVRVLAHTCDDVYVVTGPLFLPVKNSDGYRMQHLMIGQPPNMMAVPTHFFKVVLAETAGKRADGGASREVVIGAFVMPNAPLQPHLPLTAFLVPLEALEEAAGLQFFPGFLNAERRAAVDAAALAYRKWVPGASLDFFQPPKALLALTEPVRVANSAVVERNVAAFSAPSDASSSVKVAHLCGVVETLTVFQVASHTSDLGVAAMAWQGPSWCKRLPHTIIPPSSLSLIGVRAHAGMLRAPANMLHALLCPSSWGMPPQLAAACAAKRHYTIPSAAAAAAVASAVGHIPVSEQASMETQAHWESVLSGVDRPSAREMMAQLDLRHLLGLASGSTYGRGRKAPLLPFFTSVKREHPTKVLLVRVGEFYETMGTDAVVLMQWAGLNPMGNGNPPRAGCPAANIRRTLQCLVQEANLSVVVCEEAPEPRTYGTRTKQKQRFVAGIVTPAQPHYLYGLLDANMDPSLGGTPPVLAIATSAGGYKVLEVQQDMMTCAITEGLTEDAVSARLHQGGLSPPLYIHSSVQGSIQGRLSEGSVESEWEQRVVQIFRSQVGVVKRYNARDAEEGLLALLRRDLCMDADAAFTRIAAKPGERPKPLYHSTASQLGLHKTKSIPNLLDFVLPRNAPQGARRWMQRLLLLPPSPEVAAALWKACRFLSETALPLPQWTMLDASNITLKLKSQQATRNFFCDLAHMLSSVADAAADPELRRLMEWVLVAAQAETRFGSDLDGLLRACRAAVERIDGVVDRSSCGKADRSSGNGGEVDGGLEVIGRLFTANEGFRGQIRDDQMTQCINEVEVAGSRLEAELARVLNDAIHAWKASSSLAALKPVTVYDPVNVSVWLKAVAKSPVFKEAGRLGLIHPRDRNGNLVTDRFSTLELEAALEAYRAACAAAADRVRDQLRSLASRLTEALPELVCASVVSTIGAALDAHVRQAREQGWTQPRQLPRGCSNEPSPALQVQDMWPYWLDGRAPSTVRNTFDIDSMLLLTGPNMAGKSTVMRGTMSVALLGACGLFAPCEAATVPFIDAFMLRTFSADAPVEGLSSFAIEMTEMRYVLEDAGPDALVLLDELGKGTEVRAGAALAAAFLERLCTLRCKGIFATHLHPLLDMRLEAPGMRRMKMGTRWEELSSDGTTSSSDSLTAEQAHPSGTPSSAGPGGRLVPTWRIEEGECRDSLALEVAAQCKLPAEIVARASQLYQTLEAPSVMEASNGARVDDEFVADTALSDDANSSDEDASVNAVEPPAANNRSPDILQAAAVLHTCAVSLLADQQPLCRTASGASAAEEGIQNSGVEDRKSMCANGSSNGNGTCVEDLTVQVLGAGKVPPPSTAGCSCVYVVRRSDGYFYCGESDDIKARLQRHRRAGPVKGGRTMEAVYMSIPAGLAGKSAAVAIEARVIREMHSAGFPLLSVHDARTKRTPAPAERQATG
ncbi:g5776 [Coccomyxa elongata]